MSTLNKIDQKFLSELNEENLKILEAHLLCLFNLNRGDFSFQSSLLISSKLLECYKHMKNPQFFDLFSFCINNTTKSAIYAVGYIVRHFGFNMKSQLPRFTEHLIQKSSSNGFEYATIYAFRCIFQTHINTVEKYTTKIFAIAKNNTPMAKDINQTISASMNEN